MLWNRNKKPDLRSELAAANVRIAALVKRLDETVEQMTKLKKEVAGTKARLTQLEQSPYTKNRDEAAQERFILAKSNPGIAMFED